MEYFAEAFSATVDILSYASGVVVAILILAIAVLISLGVLAWLFDVITTAMGRRWRKRGKMPRSRVGQIIYRRTGDV